jgi:hypothetical protein
VFQDRIKKQDEGDELIEEDDLDALFSQGCMVTRFVTNGYLNLSRKISQRMFSGFTALF